MKRISTLVMIMILTSIILGCQQTPVRKVSPAPLRQNEIAQMNSQILEKDKELKDAKTKNETLEQRVKELEKTSDDLEQEKKKIEEEKKRADYFEEKYNEQKKVTEKIIQPQVCEKAVVSDKKENMEKMPDASAQLNVTPPAEKSSPKVVKDYYSLRIISLPSHVYYEKMSNEIVAFIKKQGIEDVASLHIKNYWVVDVGNFSSITKEATELKTHIRSLKFQGLPQFRDAYFVHINNSGMACLPKKK